MEGETEAGLAAAEGEFSITGAPNLSRLAVDGDWCSQQEEAAVVGGVQTKVKISNHDHPIDLVYDLQDAGETTMYVPSTMYHASSLVDYFRWLCNYITIDQPHPSSSMLRI